jgi:iron complex outermembrane recepter protein
MTAHITSSYDRFATRSDDSITWTVAGVNYSVPTESVFGFNPGLLPATDLWNINVNWDNVLGQPFDAAFFMTNVGNEKYPVGVGSSLTSAGFENFLYAPPRMYGFRLRFEY